MSGLEIAFALALLALVALSVWGHSLAPEEVSGVRAASCLLVLTWCVAMGADRLAGHPGNVLVYIGGDALVCVFMGLIFAHDRRAWQFAVSLIAFIQVAAEASYVAAWYRGWDINAAAGPFYAGLTLLFGLAIVIVASVGGGHVGALVGRRLLSVLRGIGRPVAVDCVGSAPEEANASHWVTRA